MEPESLHRSGIPLAFAAALAGRMKDAWITGARGFIGRYLALHLAGLSYRVSGIGHGHWAESDAKTWGLRAWENAEVNGPNLDLLAKGGGAPAVLFHLAGGSSVSRSLASPLEDFDRTVVTTARLLEWVRVAAPDTKVVLVSSAAVYGDGFSVPICEGVTPRPTSPYGEHKLMMEQLGNSASRDFGLDVAIVRLFSVYGPGLEKQLLWDLCERLRAGGSTLELGGTGDELRDWLHVADAARLLVRVAESAGASGSVVNGGTGQASSVRDVAAMVAQAWGVAPELRFNGIRRRGDPRYLVADVTRARALGFVPELEFSQGVAETVASYSARAGAT